MTSWEKGNLVDVVQRWSKRIAQRVAQEEVDSAADVGVAYAAGGKKRKELLSRPRVQPGAFGLGSYVVDLPLILRALAEAGSALLRLLGSPHLANVVAVGSLFVALRAGRGYGQASEPERPADQLATGPEPPGSEREAVEQAFASLRDRLMSAGFDQERADQLAYELLEELLSDAAEAARFVDALTAVPDDGAKSRRP